MAELKNGKKSKRSSFVLAAWLVAFFALLPLGYIIIDVQFKKSPEASMPMDPIVLIEEGIGGIGGWGFSLRRLIKDKKFSAEDFEKIDFSIPGDREYGDNPAVEFFNPEGPFEKRSYSEYLPVFIKRATTIDTPRVIVNLRRSSQKNGRVLDTLYAIIPNIKPEKCHGIAIVDRESLIETDNKRVIIDTERLKGCVRTKSSSTVYLFVPFFTRHKEKGAAEWQIY